MNNIFSSWVTTLDLLQKLIFWVVMILFFQGKGSHAVFIAIITTVPFLRVCLSPQYRGKHLKTLKKLWDELESFSIKNGKAKIPYLAVFTYSVLPLLFLALINGVSISSMDNYPTVSTAASLLLEGNTELSEMTEFKEHPDLICKSAVPLPYWLRCTPTGAYSAYPLGMLAFALPVATISKLVMGDIGNAKNQWRLQKWIAAWVAAISVGIFFVLSLHITSLPTAIFAVLFLSLGSAMLSTISQGLWTQGGVVFGFLLVLLIEVRLSLQKNIKTNNLVLITLLQAACLTLMFASRLSAVALIIPFGFWLLFRSPLRAVLVAITAICFHLPLTYYYWKIYGNFAGPQMQMGQSNSLSPDPISAFLGLLFSPAHGLLIYQPWILLILLFLHPKVQKKASNIFGFYRMFLFAIIFHIILVSLWPCWWGGQCWGSRLLSEIVPILAFFILIPIETILNSKKRTRNLIYSFLVLSFLMHFPFVYLFAGRWTGDPLKGKVYSSTEERLWDWTDPPFLYPVLRSRYLLNQ